MHKVIDLDYTDPYWESTIVELSFEYGEKKKDYYFEPLLQWSATGDDYR